MSRAVLKTLAIVVGALFALGVVLTASGIFFFGSSKVRPLFGMSADALAGDSPRVVRLDGGAANDGGQKPVTSN